MGFILATRVLHGQLHIWSGVLLIGWEHHKLEPILTFYLQHIVSDGEAAVARPLDFGHTGELSILQLKMIVKEFPID